MPIHILLAGCEVSIFGHDVPDTIPRLKSFASPDEARAHASLLSRTHGWPVEDAAL